MPSGQTNVIAKTLTDGYLIGKQGEITEPPHPYTETAEAINVLEKKWRERTTETEEHGIFNEKQD